MIYHVHQRHKEIWSWVTENVLYFDYDKLTPRQHKADVVLHELWEKKNNSNPLWRFYFSEFFELTSKQMLQFSLCNAGDAVFSS